MILDAFKHRGFLDDPLLDSLNAACLDTFDRAATRTDDMVMMVVGRLVLDGTGMQINLP